MIAGNDNICALTYFSDALIGIGSIANQVAEKPDLVNRFLFGKLIDFGQHGFQCFQVGVYISKYSVAHFYVLYSNQIHSITYVR